ncbi:MAG TPA: 16S rRNA (guanine(966)-N(2))-methyltransferase RsmD [Elusimicrobia bacterium]|nr:16S rRNA (guanine(966)-N(2))-methyltransferase RsmD [Elusimicrobiota bacterium]HBT60354.1 16S rRNA (guanine(966)-N(2))-methyltransferase RsmD [Elusimicrobiota bacterium]
MRIIAGKLRGRHIKGSGRDWGVRPISGRIKQSLFDIMRGLVPGARFLDLFAGTGAVGIEALSRGASFVFFVDLDRRCVELITRNLAASGFADRGKVHFGNILSDLSWVPYRSGESRYDIIFLGPPYKDEAKRPLAFSTAALARVAAAGLLAERGWVVCQHHVKEDVQPPPAWALVRREKYGDTFLSFFRAAPAVRESVRPTSAELPITQAPPQGPV